MNAFLSVLFDSNDAFFRQFDEHMSVEMNLSACDLSFQVIGHGIVE